MPQQRINVPDCSAIIPAFFPERLVIEGCEFDLSARARRMETAIRHGVVRATAPDVLLAEFLKIAWLKATDRRGSPTIEIDDAQSQILRFFELPITPAPAAELAATALDLVRAHSIAPADSWYVACAIYAQAELWLSHAHEDGLAERAQAAGAEVHLLTAEQFR